MFRQYILLVFIALSGNAIAQTSNSGQVWLDYNHKEFIKPNLTVGGDGGFRADVTNGNWYAVYIRPRIAYRVNKVFTIGGGLAYYYNWNEHTINNSEFRIEQQVIAKWPSFKKFHFENRLRIDERYFNYQESNEISIPDKWSARLRYRLMAKTNYFNVSSKIGNVYVLLGAETFVPFESNQSGSYVLRERIVLGFGQLLPKGRRYEVDFMWQGALNPDPGSAKSNLWILRLRFYLQKDKFKG